MQRKKFGNTGLELSPIGLGTWQFSKQKGIVGKFWGSLSDSESENIVKASFDAGINWFDTAEVYGWGESERTLSKVLKKSGISMDEVYIATKWWPVLRFSGSITKTIDQRLENLYPYPIGLYQVHVPYSFDNIKNEMKRMAELAKKGLIKHIGVSNYNAKQMREAHEELQKYGLSLASNQVKYSLLNRAPEKNGVIETAQELNVAIIAYSPLAQGILTGIFHEDPELIKKKPGFRKYLKDYKKHSLEKTKPLIDLLNKIAGEHQAKASQVALSWLINYHKDVVFAIPGASKTKHAIQNARAMDVILSDEELKQISDAITFW